MNRFLYNITPSAQAETFVQIRVIRGRKKYQRKLKHSCKFVQFVGKTPSAQAETHIKTKIDNINFQQTLSNSQALSNSNKDNLFYKIAQSSKFLRASLSPLINLILILHLHNENISNRRSWLCRLKPL